MIQRLPLRVGLVAATSWLASVPAFAQKTDTLPTLIVTANRLRDARGATTLSTTVVTGRQLQQQGIASVSDALRLVPGLTVVQAGPRGAQASLFLRGGEGDYVRVVVDGVPVNDPGGAIDLSALSLDDVDRIEVVRGPASVLYGTDAVSGVVQILTRAPASTRWRVLARGGSRRTHDAAADGAVRIDRLSLGGGLSTHADDGVFSLNNAYRSRGLQATASLEPGPRARFDLRLRHDEDTYHYPTDGAGRVEDSNAFRTGFRTTAAASGAYVTDALQVDVSAGVLGALGRTVDAPDGPADTLGFFAYRARARTRRHVLEGHVTRHMRAASATFGLEWSRDDVESADSSNYDSGTNRFAAVRETRAGYAQLAGESGRLGYLLGARYDRNSDFGGFGALRGGLSWAATPQLTVRASAGNAFKAPSFFETYSSAFSVGNPRLRPERSVSYDAGLDWTVGRSVTVQLSAFRSSFRDIIQYTYRPAPEPNYFNIAAATASGIELEGRVPVTSWLDAAGALSWLHTEVTDAGFDADAGPGASFVKGEALLRRPIRSASLHLTARPTSRTAMTVSTLHVGPRSDRDFSGFPAAPVTLPSYTRIDVSGDYHLADGPGSSWWLTFRAENLFDAAYQEVAGFPVPGRRLLIGFRAESRAAGER